MKYAQSAKGRQSRLGLCTVGLPVIAATGIAWTGTSFCTRAFGQEPQRTVLEIEVEVENGHERWKNGSEWKDGAFSQSFTLNIPYVAAASLDSINPFAPGYDINALAQAERAQAGVGLIARQDGGTGSHPFNTVLDPGRMIQVNPERMAELAERAETCHADQACLMALGTEMMARDASGEEATFVQAIAAIAAECSTSVGFSQGPAFDACMQASGERYALPPEGADTADTGPGFAEPGPARFQRWDIEWDESGGCGATLVAEYRYQAADQLNDITGPVNGTETALGAAEGPVVAAEMPLACSSNQIITDAAADTMYIQSAYIPAIPVHRVIESKLRGGLSEATAPGGLPGGPDMMRQVTLAQWLTETLTEAPLEGHAERAFRIKGDMNGVSLPTDLTGIEEIVPDETDPTAWKRQAPNFHETEFVAKVTWRLKETP